MRATYLQYIILLVVSFACSEGPRNEDARIDDSMVINKDNTNEREYVLDSAGSFISWSGTNDQISHYGIFHIDHGYINIRDSTIIGGEIVINVGDLRILDLKDSPQESARLSEFMKSKSFFNIKEFPQASFEIDSVVAIDVPMEERIRSKRTLASGPTDTVYGKLAIKGISKPLKFPARIDMRYFSLQSSARFSINRATWNIMPSSRYTARQTEGKLPDSIDVGFDIIANAQ